MQATHQLVDITFPSGSGCQAQCACGWSSGTQLSAGLAGAVWDGHAAADN